MPTKDSKEDREKLDKLEQQAATKVVREQIGEEEQGEEEEVTPSRGEDTRKEETSEPGEAKSLSFLRIS